LCYDNKLIFSILGCTQGLRIQRKQKNQLQAIPSVFKKFGKNRPKLDLGAKATGKLKKNQNSVELIDKSAEFNRNSATESQSDLANNRLTFLENRPFEEKKQRIF
jgi:hypothetical protein